MPAATKFRSRAVRIVCALTHEIGRHEQGRPDAQIPLHEELRNSCACYEARRPPVAMEMFSLERDRRAADNRLTRNALFRGILCVLLVFKELFCLN
jgi:hypothetical protein